MGLQGRLEDLALLDMIQVIAFSQKTGCLRVESPHGNGMIVFRAGRMLFCSSWSTVAQFSRLPEERGDDRKQTLQNLCISSMRDLAGLTQGHFVFDVSQNFDFPFEGLSVSELLMETGLDPQNLLLKLSKEIDEARRDASEKLGEFDDWAGPDLDEAFASVMPAPSTTAEAASGVTGKGEGSSDEAADPPSLPITVVVVDDEPAVVSTVGMGLRSDGLDVKEATTPADGRRAVDAAQKAGGSVVLVVDLKMPTTDGLSFLGGLELVSGLKDAGQWVPTLLMVESLNVEEKQVARALGLRRVIYKPTLTKADPQLYAEDLNRLAAGVGGQVELMVNAQSRPVSGAAEPDSFPGPGPTGTPSPAELPESSPNAAAPPSTSVGSSKRPAAKPQKMTAYLAEVTQRLESPTSSSEVSKMVLEVASRYLERGILFLLRGDAAYGVAGFRLRQLIKGVDVKTIRVAAAENKAFRSVIGSRGIQRQGPELDGFEAEIYSKIGRGKTNQSVLLPLVVNGQVLTILYGDNGLKGKPIGALRGLQAFVQQASFAMQAALLKEKQGGK